MSDFRELNEEEWEALTNEGQKVPVVIDDQKPLELGRQIWELALQGENRDRIALRLQIPLEVLDETLNAYRVRLGQSIDTYRILDNERIDRLLAYWIPIAVSGGITVEKIAAGEVYTEKDIELSLKASNFAIGAMERRIKILGATANLMGGDPNDGNSYTERGIMIWLKTVVPSIEKISQELEVESIETVT